MSSRMKLFEVLSKVAPLLSTTIRNNGKLNYVT